MARNGSLFVERDDGIIEIGSAVHELDLTEMLNDAVSSEAPRDALHQGLSTYWIDRTEATVRQAAERESGEWFAQGNSTYLRLVGNTVHVGNDWDSEESDQALMPLGEFLALLGEWRRRVIAAGGASGPEAAMMEDRSGPSLGRS